MFYKVKEVIPEPGYRLRLVFNDRRVFVCDLKPVIEQGGVFASLEDERFFSEVKIRGRGRYLEWPGGIDFCADALRVDGVEVSADMGKRHSTVQI